MLDKVSTERCIKRLIKGLSDEKSIIEKLESARLIYEVDKDCCYMNIKIPVKDGCVRIYKAYDGRIVVQTMSKVKFQYSGVPVFFDDSLF